MRIWRSVVLAFSCCLTLQPVYADEQQSSMFDKGLGMFDSGKLLATGGVSNLEIGGIVAEVHKQMKADYGIVPVRVIAGTFITSLHGLGFSVSVLKLEDTGLGAGKSMLELLDAELG